MEKKKKKVLVSNNEMFRDLFEDDVIEKSSKPYQSSWQEEFDLRQNPPIPQEKKLEN
jgi:hypothetical protein